MHELSPDSPAARGERESCAERLSECTAKDTGVSFSLEGRALDWRAAGVSFAAWRSAAR